MLSSKLKGQITKSPPSMSNIANLAGQNNGKSKLYFF